MKLDTTTASTYFTAEIARLTAGWLKQADAVFGFKAPHVPLDEQTAELHGHILETLKERVEAGADPSVVAERFAGRSTCLSALEFRQSFAVEATLTIKLKVEVEVERNRTFAITLQPAVEIGAPSTTRDLASSTAFAMLLTQVAQLGALIEATGRLFIRIPITKDEV